ncbi:hypothetical protein [Rathayibacter toxicus]|uniref:Uncharacterized protein n=1 Tax=Rathayibacter toxicus TaxID=145458 RepID=A0A0C5BE59_9MICO|nr:hypothetical protein [Rathayibacter toxicus]AJM77521.1 hypothetical protein TI83_05350 [Rathayibacter toxicus]ALS56561.1 hypothetical protein APU90_01125 [Rathayibacter toxicus]KKM44656.1 hypothetical protein VT73_09090 [Rathayibacter toxicus]PPG21611.1 hypothetical protein C5D15_05145 [Rathayibacter toxicus]PPG46573.1 hypothetical protein C5D16_05120 [Rathayibacter toxicus]
MDHSELARTLHSLAKEELSDSVTRAVNRGELTVSPLVVRSIARSSSRRSLGRRRVGKATVQTEGVNAWSFDDSTAVALARGGLLLRDPEDGVFSSPTVAELAAARDEAALNNYLSQAQALITSVRGGYRSSSLPDS